MKTIETPTHKDKKLAKESLGKVMEHIGKSKVSVQLGDTSVVLPSSVLDSLGTILSSLAEGKGVTIMPLDEEITTQQAANMLHVSRPYVVKLLEKGEIPFKKVGNQRRISMGDLLKYKHKMEENRQKGLKLLAEEAQDMNLGY